MKKYAFDVMRALLCSLVILLFLMLPEIVFGFINTKLAVCGNTDKLVMKILNFARSSKHKTYLFYLSDHGEALGENGVWGHGHLSPENLEIPFMFTMFNGTDDAFTARLREKNRPCAHDVSLWVAEKLGWKVEVTGEDLNVCQVNGRDTMGRAGVLKIIKNNDGTTDFKLEK